MEGEREREILIRPGNRSLPFGKGLEIFLGVSTLAFCVLFFSSFPLCSFFFIFFLAKGTSAGCLLDDNASSRSSLSRRYEVKNER